MAVKGAANQIQSALKKIRAYHGSPHDFDKFSLKHIGAGEGAQAYGHGLYFSSSDEIARYYRNTLSNRIPTDKAYVLAAKSFIDDAGDVSIKDLKSAYPDADDAQLAAAIAEAKGTSRGKLYTVEIPDESLMLDWDKPLSEQPENVRDALHQLAKEDAGADELLERLNPDSIVYEPEMPGMVIYRMFSVDPGSRHGASKPENMARASANLKELGIPGITYKGRTSDERNFVIFDDELINLIEKGQIDPKLLAPLMGAGAAGMYAQSQMADTSPAESTLNASTEDLKAAHERFKAMRQGKGMPGLKDAIATMASAVGGGVVGDLSRIGGYLNPFMPVERTEEGAQALEDKLQYVPKQPNSYLESIGRGVEQFEQDLQPITGGWEQSIPGQIYNRLPERVQGLLRVGADWAL